MVDIDIDIDAAMLYMYAIRLHFGTELWSCIVRGCPAVENECMCTSVGGCRGDVLALMLEPTLSCLKYSHSENLPAGYSCYGAAVCVLAA